MPLATYKDLCIDAVDPDRMGRFWAAALGLRPVVLDDGDLRLRGATSAHTVWVNRVPESVTVKQRVHLDVHTGSVADLEALGATVVDADSFPWTVMRDPEGGELCAFVRAEVPDYRLYEVCVDTSADAHRVAAWWRGLLGGVVVDDDSGFASLEDVPGLPFDGLTFATVPEPKTVKNRVHLDVTAAALEPLLDHGATVVRARDDEISWTVLADPDGNELCAFT
jgi:catechol 2,3-dioxygenase-like lactoylglutathione lyase family enzyme